MRYLVIRFKMTTIHWSGSEWIRGLTPRRRILMDICRRLDDEEIEQMRFPDDMEECPLCFSPKFGILDEGKLRQPLPKVLGGKGLYDFYFPGDGLEPNAIWFHPSTGKQIRGRMTDYEICQSIVMTGLFTREQLGLSQLTNHELEVCERRFAEIRPLRCECDFGSPTEAEFSDFVSSKGKYGDLVPVDGLTAVEHSFVTGKPVRTGYRRRSLAKVRERRLRYRERHRNQTPVKGVIPKPLPGFAMQDVNPAPIELKFNFVPYGRHSRQYKRTADFILSKRKEIRVKKLHKQRSYFVTPTLVLPRVQVSLPKPSHPKYWYYLRKRGYYYHSLHHPYGDELDERSRAVINDFPT